MADKLLNFRCPDDLLLAIDALGQKRYPANNSNGCDRSKTLLDIVRAGLQSLSDGSIEIPVSKTSKTNSKTLDSTELLTVLRSQLLTDIDQLVSDRIADVRQEIADIVRQNAANIVQQEVEDVRHNTASIVKQEIADVRQDIAGIVRQNTANIVRQVEEMQVKLEA